MNNPREISKANWNRIQDKLSGIRQQVYRAMLAAKQPQTTIDIAATIGTTILTVRPRVTELCQLGLAEFAGRIGREGLYRAIPLEQVKRNIDQSAMDACQLQLL